MDDVAENHFQHRHGLVAGAVRRVLDFSDACVLCPCRGSTQRQHTAENAVQGATQSQRMRAAARFCMNVTVHTTSVK